MHNNFSIYKVLQNNSFQAFLVLEKSEKDFYCFLKKKQHLTESQGTQVLMSSICPWADFIPSCVI